MRDEAAVTALAERAAEHFGRVDVWVNNAGVMAYGRFDQVPSAVFRAVIETNFMGQVHGARAALVQFRRQGSGVLISMSSVWGRVTAPDVSAYVASKFAIRAFSESLRQELRNTPGIDVALILPQAVDTPIFLRAANFAGRPARPIPPLVDPEEVASGILKCARSPKPEVTYSRSGRVLEIAHSIAPRLWDRFLPPPSRPATTATPPSKPGAAESRSHSTAPTPSKAAGAASANEPSRARSSRPPPEAHAEYAAGNAGEL